MDWKHGRAGRTLMKLADCFARAAELFAVLKGDLDGVGNDETAENMDRLAQTAREMSQGLTDARARLFGLDADETGEGVSQDDIVHRMDRMIPKLEDVFDDVNTCVYDFENAKEGTVDSESFEALWTAKEQLAHAVDNFEIAYLRFADALGHDTSNYCGEFSGDPYGGLFR